MSFYNALAPMDRNAERKDRRPASAGYRWTVYIVRCSNGSLYTGITNRLMERLAAHNAGTGARYTAAFGPVRLAWSWSRPGLGRSGASRLEALIKKLSRREKEELIAAGPCRIPSGPRALPRPELRPLRRKKSVPGPLR